MSAADLTLAEKVVLFEMLGRRQIELQAALNQLPELVHKHRIPYDATRTVLDSELAVVNAILPKVRP